jgi:ferredoxin--NADP+ reductase
VYAAAALLGDDRPVSVDVFDAVPAPYGLVRYGVAPDHPKIKSVADKLATTLGASDVRYFGGVSYGTDLDLDDLRRHYHAIIFAVGSPHERGLGIAGEDLPGTFGAAEFVAWYNGHPDAIELDYLSAREVVVVGAGNVALDVARMIVTDAATLEQTDIPAAVLDKWRECAVTDVHILARRGPAQAKFTTPELREMAELDGVALHVDPADLDLDPVSADVVETDRVSRRNVDVLRKWAAEGPEGGAARRVHFRFWTRPTEITGTEHVEAVAVERTEFDTDGRLRATGESTVIRAAAVFRAIGYAGKELPGLPFDDDYKTVPNEAGRVPGPNGIYVAGWIKRGPTGVIGTNKSDANETVRTLLADADGLTPPLVPRPDAVPAMLDQRGIRYVRWDQWLVLDKHEITEGARIGRPRLKVCTADEMLAIGREASG